MLTVVIVFVIVVPAATASTVAEILKVAEAESAKLPIAQTPELAL